MPPISGIQAMAAATFEGKPVEVDVVFISGSGLDEGGGWVGSTGSGMTYIHKLGNVLSSNLPVHCNFASISLPTPLSWPFPKKTNDQKLLARFYVNRIAGCHRGHRHSRHHRVPGLHRHPGTRESNKGHEQSPPDRNRHAAVSE